jgi:hypothetical protein
MVGEAETAARRVESAGTPAATLAIVGGAGAGGGISTRSITCTMLMPAITSAWMTLAPLTVMPLEFLTTETFWPCRVVTGVVPVGMLLDMMTEGMMW